jgi:hypothetical protein
MNDQENRERNLRRVGPNPSFALLANSIAWLEQESGCAKEAANKEETAKTKLFLVGRGFAHSVIIPADCLR